MLEAVEKDFPVLLNSSPVTGATAPITLAGTLVVMNAEILAAITVAQLAKPGAKILYAGFHAEVGGRAGLGFDDVARENGGGIVSLVAVYPRPGFASGIRGRAHGDRRAVSVSTCDRR